MTITTKFDIGQEVWILLPQYAAEPDRVTHGHIKLITVDTEWNKTYVEYSVEIPHPRFGKVTERHIREKMCFDNVQDAVQEFERLKQLYATDAEAMKAMEDKQ